MPYDPFDTGTGWSYSDPDAPRFANPADSRFGGMTPWENSIQEFIKLGTPGYGDRPFSGLGKTNVANVTPYAPVATPARNAPVPEPGAPQPGLAESLTGGLATLATELPLGAVRAVGLGSGHIDNLQNLITGLASGAGALFDGAIDFFPNAIGVQNVGFLPGGGDIAATYEDLPEDKLKREIDAQIAKNPSARMYYMKQYLDRRGGEIARQRGVSGMFAEMATPSQSISEQLRRLIFGGLMAPGDLVARTFVGSGIRDINGTMLNADDSTLPAELVDLKQRYKAGELSYDDLLDEVSIGRFRWTQDEGWGGMMINTLLDIGTDPVFLASMGLGTAASITAKMGKLGAAIKVARAVNADGSVAARAASSLASKFGMSPEAFLKSTKFEHKNAILDWAKDNAPDAYRKGLSELSRGEKVSYYLDDVLQPASKVANEIDSMFGMFGLGKVGEYMRPFRNSRHMAGMMRAAGYKNVLALQRLFGDSKFDLFQRLNGVASANLSIHLGQKQVVDELMAAERGGEAFGRAGVATPDITPTERARSYAQSSLKEGLESEGEAATYRYNESLMRGNTAADQAAVRTGVIDSLTGAIVKMTGQTDAAVRKVLVGMNDQGLGYAHRLVYASNVRKLSDARATLIDATKGHLDQAQKAGNTAEVERLQKVLAEQERYTLVSENTLTRAEAERLVQELAHDTDAARAQARNELQRYDQLDINWGNDVLADPEMLRKKMVEHLKALIDNPKALVDVIEPKNLNRRLQGILDGGYRIGLAPEDAWGVTRRADTSVLGVNPWVDAISDLDVGYGRKIHTFDRIKEGLFGPIRGSRIHAETKLRMRNIAQQQFNMSRADADAFLSAINRASIDSGKGLRAFGADEFMEIARKASIEFDEATKARYGDRVALELALRAFEGNINMMGIASGISAKVKSKAGRLPLGDNLLSKIAEDIYPKLRFTYSPMFLAMELWEGPFFGILRGIKPGWRWTKRDLEANSIVRVLEPDFVEHGQGMSRGIVAMGDKQLALRVTTEGNWFDRIWNKVLPERFERTGWRIRGPRFFNVYEWKRLMYVRQIAQREGREFVERLQRFHPEALESYTHAYGTANPTDLWIRYMTERGAFDPSARHQVHMLDAAKPSSMYSERIRLGDVAQFHRFKDVAEMRDAINGGALDRDGFIKAYEDLGLDRGYAERAWLNAEGATVEEFAQEAAKALGSDAAGKAWMDFHSMMAKMARKPLDQFLNEQYGDLPTLVNNARRIPGAALKQTVDETLGYMGATPRRRGDAIFERTRAIQQTLLPDPASLDPKSPLKKDVRLGQEKLAKGEGKPTSTRPGYEDLLSDDLAVREKAYKSMYSDVLGVFGDENKMYEAANWYDEMSTIFIGLTEVMDDAVVERLLHIWDQFAPEKFEATFGTLQERIQRAYDAGDTELGQRLQRAAEQQAIDAKGITGWPVSGPQSYVDPAEARAHLAARLNIAFSGSQMNTSVLEGMKKVTDMLDEVYNTKDVRALREEAYVRLFQKTSDPKTLALQEEFWRHDTTPERRLAIIDQKVGTRFGFTAVGARMESLLRDFEGMPTEQVAQKLSDFNDNLAGRTFRSSDPASGLQPAAMDIWMKRIYGFGDTAYLKDLTDERMRLTGETFDVAEKAILEERGWDKSKLDKPKAPDDVQYEWMLRNTNEFAQWLNKEGIKGPGGREWSAHEIQALLWVGEQKRLGAPESPTFAVMTQTASQITPESALSRHPGALELVAAHGPEGLDILRTVQRDTYQALIQEVSKDTGVGVLRTLDSIDGTAPTSVLFGSRAMGYDTAARVAAASGQNTVRIAKASTNGPNRGALTFAFSPDLHPVEVRPYMQHLTEWLRDKLPDSYTHLVPSLQEDNGLSVRAIAKSKGEPSPSVIAKFLSEEDQARLADGTWVHDLQADAEPMAVNFIPEKVDFEVITPEEGRAHVGRDDTVHRYRTEAGSAADEAYATHAPQEFATSARRHGLDGDGTLYQRGSAGVRAGFLRAHGAQRARAYFVRGATDPSTAVHESFHLFARNLDTTARRSFLDAYNDAHGLAGRRRKRAFTDDVEEWVAYEFERFANGDVPPNAIYASTFKAFSEWGKKNPAIPKGSAIAPLFDKVLSEWADVPAALADLDEVRIWDSTRASFLRAEEEAHATVYYKRGTNWMLRSMNHPYLGFYPASYMWGKVLPELTRFLVRRPFGLKAPLAGLMAYNHVQRNIQLQLNTDPEMADYLDKHPETFRFLSLMLPGSPVEMPVNLPVVGRRAAELYAENKVAAMQGQKQAPYDVAGWLGDTLSYAVGFTQLPERMGKMIGEWSTPQE